jgi:hypothetical protein
MKNPKNDASDAMRRVQLYITPIIGVQTTGVEVAARTPVHEGTGRFRRSDMGCGEHDHSEFKPEFARGSPVAVGFLHLMHVSMV